ncbi:2-dehydropantoate 2-reductase [Corynebacterium diphtheriae]
MHIVIVGAGAVGGFFGGLLHESGTKVTFVARGESLDVLQRRGMRLHDASGVRDIRVPVVEDLSQVPDADVVILATKTLGSVDLPKELPAHAVLVTTQNSVEMPHIAIEAYGADRVIPGVVRSFLTKRGPAEAEFSGGIFTFTFGCMSEGTRGIVDKLAHVLDRAGIEPVVHPAIMTDIWFKAMFVTCFGALGALVNQPLGVVRTTYRDDFKALINEVVTAGQAHGVDFPEDVVDRVLAFVDAQPKGATSSMQRDLADGLSSELDAQVGAVVRMAQRVGADARLHHLVGNVLSHKHSD